MKKDTILQDGALFICGELTERLLLEEKLSPQVADEVIFISCGCYASVTSSGT